MARKTPSPTRRAGQKTKQPAARQTNPKHVNQLKRKADKYDRLVEILKAKMADDPRFSDAAAMLEELGELPTLNVTTLS